MSVCLLIFKIVNSLTPEIASIILSSSGTRGTDGRLIILGKCASAALKHSICVDGAILWNGLPSSLRSMNCKTAKFKFYLKEFFCS